MNAAGGSMKRIVPPLAVIALLVATWWLLVVLTRSAIFPTPWQVVTATLELIRDGTLWGHIGASLLRVEILGYAPRRNQAGGPGR